jgi:starch synthase
LGFEADVLHCHDWQAGMIPALLREQYGALPFYQDIHTVFTIHNLQYQGVFGIDYIDDLLGFGYDKYTADRLEFYGCTSFMKAGIVYSDEITTVSPTYAEEIQTGFYGERLDGLLRARLGQLSGVLNGLDTDVFNPQTDSMIYQPYAAATWKARKAHNKACLQTDLGLAVNPDAPLIGMVTRLSPQKGLDLVERVFDELMQEGIEVVVLGKGDDRFVNFFSWAAWRYQGQMATRIEMNETLAHRIYAGCDMLLMPSQFEPCGLSQMIAMRYGTVPIVRETGGLRDTVLAYNEFTGEGNGFSFFNYNAHDMLAVVRRAVGFYRNDKTVWETLVKRGMAGDYGWESSARAYQAIYQRAGK